ncbi:MAG: RnfH family protein [Rhodocyclaceae bacterium]|nr:MAG: RnfH family protein [Rhodocyclaceae bacterium]
MKIKVAYATLRRQAVLPVEQPEGATVRDAIQSSGILKQFPEIDLEKQKVGIFNKVCTLDAKLAEGDRVEIYCPLTVDPKTVKKKEKAKAEGSAQEPDA